MGLIDLQSHVQIIPGATATVDLLKLANERSKNDGPLKLIVDAECCLDRLYGGFYPDWVCGGQWDKMEKFLRNFAVVVQNSNLDLTFFLNGTTDVGSSDQDSRYRYLETYRLLDEITKHVATKKKPPPKVWWIPPTFLRSAIRLAFRLLDVKVMCTLDEHHKDIVRFSQTNKFHGIVADSPDYLVIEDHRYFSAQKLKLTFKGSLETVEIKLKKVYETLNVPKERIFIFSALLCNHILSEEDLKDFYASLGIENSQSKEAVIEKVAQFTRELDSADIEIIAATVCGSEINPALHAKVIKSFLYYQDIKTPSPVNKSKVKKPKKSKPLKHSPKSPASDKGIQETVDDVQGENKADSTTISVLKKESLVAKLAYRINPRVEEVAFTRHKNGVMSPYICQIIKQKEVRLPLLIEDIRPASVDVPRAHEVFRPLRQRVYAVLLNLHHIQFLAKQNGEEPPALQVNETWFCTRTKTVKTQAVNAIEVGWPVPTVEKLWLGDGEDCKNKRIRVFFSLMKSENRAIFDPEFVPQQMVVLASVLRYILQSDKKIIRQHELDAFVAQAFIQDMTDANLAQDIEVTNLSMRGVHLSHLFMEGVEMALLANDSCGAPLPYMLFCPWLFFNGKIFNYILERQTEGKGLTDICGYKADLLYSVEQLTLAILDGIKNPFAPNPSPQLFVPGKSFAAGLMNPLIPGGPYSRVPFSGVPNQQVFGGAAFGAGSALLSQYGLGGYVTPRSRGYDGLISNNHQLHPAYGSPLLCGDTSAGTMSHNLLSLYNNSALSRQRRVQSRGGQLEVAGMVVGSWGANYGPSGLSSGSAANYGSTLPRSAVFMDMHQNAARVTPHIHALRISNSHANKAPNLRAGPGNHWAQKRGTRPSKKAVIKKSEKDTKRAASTSDSENKSKGVTFDDGDKSNICPEIEVGASVDPITETVCALSLTDNASGQPGESSPEHENISEIADVCAPTTSEEIEA